MKKLIIIIILMPLIVFSQVEHKNYTFGIYGAYGLNFHDGEFNRIPDCPSCSPGFRTGSGAGLGLGLVFDYKLNPRYSISSKLIYNDLSGEFTQTENTSIIVNNQLANGEFTHYLESTLGVVGLEPSVKINIFKDLFFNAGLNVSLLMTKDYSQVEKITQPTNSGTFLDENGDDSFSRERNNFSGTLEEANSIYIAPMASLSYQLPLNSNKSFLLEPEIGYYYGITNIVNDDLVPKWAVNRLNFGIALKYNPLEKIEKEKIFKQENKIDTIKIDSDLITKSEIRFGKASSNTEIVETKTQIISTEYISRTDTILTPKIYNIDGKLIAMGVDENGNEIPNPKFIVEEYVSNRLDPLLNYIFFDENSSNLADRYQKMNNNSVKEFNINNLYRDSTLQLYYNILNIIGKRLLENPSANITLIGCNSDFETEKGNLKLSEERANTVKNYLVNNWQIKENRIKVSKRNLPEKASTPTNEADKIAENRRVEIYSDNPKILEPIFIEKIDRSSNPPIVRFKLDVKSDLPLTKWELKSYQESEPNNNFNKTGTTQIQKQVDWQLSENQKIVPHFEESLKSELTLEDKKGNTKIIQGNDLKIEVKTIAEKRKELSGDYEIERFSMILFDFDKATIEGNNKQIIEFIKSRIKENSEVEIIGYTDRTGNAEYNQKLAEDRSKVTQKMLNRPDASVMGIGSSQLLYNNDIPEGRFYCRTVNIVVKTKVKKV